MASSLFLSCPLKGVSLEEGLHFVKTLYFHFLGMGFWSQAC